MRILVPDAQYDDDATVERAVAGEGVAFAVHRERSPERIPDETWAARGFGGRATAGAGGVSG